MANFGNITEPDYNMLVEELNDEMRMIVLPVTVFVGIEMLLGFFGNLLVIYVFLFRYQVCNFRYFVLSLAFVDIISSVTTMPGEIVTHLFWYKYPFPTICKIKSFFNMFTVCAEAFCLLTISIDRYLKVCRPFGWQIRPKAAVIICGVIYFCSIVLAFPVPIFWGTHSHEKVYKNVIINVTVCEKDEAYNETKHPYHYSLSIEGIMSTCLIIMFGLYVIVAKRLFQNRRERRSSTRLTIPTFPTGLKPIRSPVSVTGTLNDSGMSSDFNDVENTHSTTKPETVNLSVEMTNDLDSSALASNDSDIGADTTQTSSADLEKRKVNVKRNGTKVEANTTRTKSQQLRKRLNQKGVSSRIHRKTLIMFILTVVFIMTTILYMTLLSFIAKSDGILEDMGHGERTVYFLFFRLYFINHVINPVIYGFLDPKFRAFMSSICRK